MFQGEKCGVFVKKKSQESVGVSKESNGDCRSVKKSPWEESTGLITFFSFFDEIVGVSKESFGLF